MKYRARLKRPGFDIHPSTWRFETWLNSLDSIRMETSNARAQCCYVCCFFRGANFCVLDEHMQRGCAGLLHCVYIVNGMWLHWRGWMITQRMKHSAKSWYLWFYSGICLNIVFDQTSVINAVYWWWFVPAFLSLIWLLERVIWMTGYSVLKTNLNQHFYRILMEKYATETQSLKW